MTATVGLERPHETRYDYPVGQKREGEVFFGLVTKPNHINTSHATMSWWNAPRVTPLNPSTSWAESNSIWGKIAMVLFYSFVWIQVIGALWSLTNVTSGWECLYETLGENEHTKAFVTGTMKTVNVWILGFFVYAHYFGCRLANIFCVSIVYAAQWIIFQPVMTELLQDSCADTLHMFHVSMIVTEGWIVLALLCACIDKCFSFGETGGGEESTSLLPAEE